MKYADFIFTMVLFAMLAHVSACVEDDTDNITDKLEIAWDNYYDTVDFVEQEFINSDTYARDKIHQTGAHELLSMLMAANMAFIMKDPDYTNFSLMESPSRRIGIDNPDNFYRSATIWNPDGKHIYKVWGNRGTTADFLMETFYSPDPSGAIAVLEDEDMKMDKDGNFVVYLSAKRENYMDNWMKLKKDPKIFLLIIRNNYSEWDKENSGVVYIERKGSSGVKSGNVKKDELVQRINNAQQVLERQGTFWPDFAAKIGILAENTLMKFKTTGEIGILSQKSSLGHWNLKDDEALIVTLKEVDADYCGFQTANFWGSSPDWRNNFTSLSWGRNGKSQAYKSRDGLYHIVISKRDPQIQNWIETSGMKEGIMALRLQSLKTLDLDFTPKTKVVKFLALKNSLPDDIPFFSRSDRKKQLKIRQQHALNRYTYW